MGLKIGYKMYFEGSQNQLKEVIEDLHKSIKKITFNNTEPIPSEIYEYNSFPKYKRKPGRRSKLWFLEIVKKCVELQWFCLGNANNCFNPITDYGIGFIINIGQGSEPLKIAFGNINIEKTKWGSSCIHTKTQYALDFINTHLLAISILDSLAFYGIKVEVQDQGNYYNTRDINILINEFNIWNQLVNDIKDFAGKKVKLK
jgi:hypothetical protein